MNHVNKRFFKELALRNKSAFIMDNMTSPDPRRTEKSKAPFVALDKKETDRILAIYVDCMNRNYDNVRTFLAESYDDIIDTDSDTCQSFWVDAGIMPNDPSPDQPISSNIKIFVKIPKYIFDEMKDEDTNAEMFEDNSPVDSEMIKKSLQQCQSCQIVPLVLIIITILKLLPKRCNPMSKSWRTKCHFDYNGCQIYVRHQ